MLTKEEAKFKLKDLVEQFKSANLNKDFINSQNEEWVKWNYIEPLLEILGWARQDIQKEERILKGRADYILKSGNEEFVVVEAKKVGTLLSEDEGRQAVSYSYHRKIKFAILTNFKQIRVYHALSNIKNIDNNLLKQDHKNFILNFNEFEEKFELLWLLSKESFENKEINKLLSYKDEKINKPIDENILQDMLEIRRVLSTELKSVKNNLDQKVIDEVVQILIDRLIFVRSVEDRGIEPKNYLLSLESDVRNQRIKLQLFPHLLEEFKKFDKKYDSTLFEEGLLEKEGAFSDKVLEKVIKILYNGLEGTQERYQFDQIPGDLFGGIYEQYLGTILQSTEKRVKLNKESGKRKRMGIYYTPAYIVDYIVKNTVGKYIKDKTIDEILEVNIVDPACGSGSFLIRAFQEVCDKVEELLDKGERSKNYSSFKEYKGQLNLSQKTTILSNCIYGVDLDEKAVELARLNLLLKVLEGEGPEIKAHRLPELTNIKCGNSLIDDPKVSDHAFKWQAQFKDVFEIEGFDIVIGNPPYIRIQNLGDSSEKNLKFYEENYDSARGNFDVYSLFVEKGHKLLKKEGLLGFILPNKFFLSNYGKPLRDYILKDNSLKEIVNFKDNQIFEGASTYTCLLFLEKINNPLIKYSEMSKIKNIHSYLQMIPSINNFDNGDLLIGVVKPESLKNIVWNFNVGNAIKIMDKLNLTKSKFIDYTEKIFVGLQTSGDSIYIVKKVSEADNKLKIISEETAKQHFIEKAVTKPLIKGKDLERYYVDYANRILLFPYIKNEQNYEPLIEEQLQKYEGLYGYFKNLETKIKARESKKLAKSKSWFALTYPRSINLYDKTKIITPNSAFRASFYIDKEIHYYMTCGVAGGFAIILKEEYNKYYEYFLAILNSGLMDFFNRKIGTSLQGGYYSYDPKIIGRYPLVIAGDRDYNKVTELVNQMLELQKKYHNEKIAGNEKERLKQQIDNIDYEIDQEVYKLYGITKEEQKIIEESLKQK